MLAEIGFGGKAILHLKKRNLTTTKDCISKVATFQRRMRKSALDETAANKAAVHQLRTSEVASDEDAVKELPILEPSFLEAHIGKRAMLQVSILNGYTVKPLGCEALVLSLVWSSEVGYRSAQGVTGQCDNVSHFLSTARVLRATGWPRI